MHDAMLGAWGNLGVSPSSVKKCLATCNLAKQDVYCNFLFFPNACMHGIIHTHSRLSSSLLLKGQSVLEESQNCSVGIKFCLIKLSVPIKSIFQHI